MIFLERTLWGISLILILAFVVSAGAQQLRASKATQWLEATRALRTGQPDMVDWSAQRKAAYAELQGPAVKPTGIIRIHRISVEAPIFTGTDEDVLDLGVGWIEGTAPLGQAGNVGLAAHRDGFFRGLKDVLPGDRIQIMTRDADLSYRVTRTEIVAPTDTHVLASSDKHKLTLVTCHPFYFVGNAPNRFIVHAIAINKAGKL